MLIVESNRLGEVASATDEGHRDDDVVVCQFERDGDLAGSRGKAVIQRCLRQAVPPLMGLGLGRGGQEQHGQDVEPCESR